MPVTKHVPIRQCIATGEKRPKHELIRLVRVQSADGTEQVVVDPKGKLRGRGANLLPTLEAFDLAVKKRAIPRALKLEHDLTPEQLQALRQTVADTIGEKEFRKGQKPVNFKVSKDELETKLGD